MLLLLAVGALIAAAARNREVRVFNRWQVRLPPPELAIRQLLISALDLTASAAALWFLLPSDIVGLPAFFAWYAMAVALGLLSHVPGGLGVFEAVILLACGGRAPPEQIIGALVLYRIIYYLLPLIAAATLLAGYELRSGVAAPIRRAAVAISPLLLATLTFIAGAWLLVSGVTPLSGAATDLLELHVPLPLVEASHFIGSVAGFAMLVDRARPAASAGCGVVGRIPARAHRCGAGDAEGHRAVGGCISHRAGIPAAGFAPPVRAALGAVLARARRRVDPVDRLGRRGLLC